MSLSCISSASLVSLPEYNRLPARTSAELWPFIMSAMPSAAESEILPFTKARIVNSPAFAGRAPAASTALKTARESSTPPWQCSSTTSSPVKECGALKYTHRPKSVMPPAAVMLPEYMYLGLNFLTAVLPDGEKTFSATGRASAPLILIMATPPAAGAVEIAAIHSPFILQP